MIVLLLIAVATLPDTAALRESVDVIELNTVWHETTCETDPLQYRVTFQQILFREWNEHTGNHEIVAWRMVKGFPVEQHEDIGDPPEGFVQPKLRQKTNMIPGRHGDVWVMRWLDGDVERIVTARSFVQTETLGDPELWERDQFAKEKRRELRPYRKAK